MKIERVITAFLEDQNDRTLYIKGKWGTGKTHFIKKFLGSDGLMEKYSFSYSSLAGIKNADDIKRRLLANLIIAKDGIFSKIENSIRPYLWMLIESPEIIQSLMPKELKNIEIKKLSKALIDPSLKQLKAIIVLDDLERCKLKDFEEIYTFISFLKESTSCKVILIGNSDNSETSIPATENPKRFSLDIQENAEWKDKIIDCEMAFSLNHDEIASLFTEDSDIRNCIKSCLYFGRANDLRKIRKAAKVCDIVVGFINVSHAITPATKKAIVEKSFFAAIEKLLNAGETDAAKTSATASNTDIDISIYNLIENGYLSEPEKNELLAGISSLAKSENRFKQYEALRYIRNQIFYSFATNEEITQDIISFLENCDEISCVDMCAFRIILETNNLLNEDISNTIKESIKEKTEAMTARELSFVLTSIRDKRIADMISKHALKENFKDLKEAFRAFEHQTENVCRYIESCDVKQAMDVILSIRSEIDFAKIKEIYRQTSLNSKFSDVYKGAKNKLDEIFEEMLLQNHASPLNIERINYLKEEPT